MTGRVRPTPEEMLAVADAVEAEVGRGRLKVFFGMAPGVGKTYAMLRAAGERRAEGVDVVIGWVETHGRAETAALCEGLERVPPRTYVHRGVELHEMDLDGVLARSPALVIVDELAHTDAPGARHRKRWQDVEELLEAGIDVLTTLNVQHLESLNDVVARITGVVVRETVPDALFHRAEVEVVDLAPEALLARLREGKVYLGDAADAAAANFFRMGNLIALRELALRRTTERVDAQVEAWRRAHAVGEPWDVGERLLVAVGPAPSSADLVRAACRIATRMRAPWIAVTVENAHSDALSAADRERCRAALGLAEQLGAEVVVLRADRVADAIVDLCRKRNVGRVVIGRPTHARWRDRVRGSLVDALIRRAVDIDVLVTSGAPDDAPAVAPSPAPPSPARDWIEAVGWVGLSSALGLGLRGVLEIPDLAMLQLLGVVIAAARVRSRPSLLAAGLAVVLFDLLFVPPFGTLKVADLRYVLTFAVMFAVGVVVSRLTWRIRSQAEASVHRERRTAALYAMTRDFANEVDLDALARTAVRHVRDHLQADAVLWWGAALDPLAGGEHPMATNPRELAVARWVLEHGHPAGVGTDTLPSGEALHLPLVGSVGPIGVLAIAGGLSGDARSLADTFARQVGLALERSGLASDAERSRLAIETERLRNELLSAVSHDLRTPLASITGSATAMLADPGLSADARRDLLETIREEGEHLGRLLTDLLDLTRIESETISARLERVPVEEVVDAALARTEARLGGRRIRVDLPDDVVTAPMDPTLIEQVLVNLLENAAKHTPADAEVAVVVRAEADQVTIEVADGGPGIPDGEQERIFEKFYRTADGQRVAGTGLGLAIVRAVVKAHGGRVFAANRPEGGARFVVALRNDAGNARGERTS